MIYQIIQICFIEKRGISEFCPQLEAVAVSWRENIVTKRIEGRVEASSESKTVPAEHKGS